MPGTLGSEATLINVDSAIHDRRFLSADEATKLLGIKRETLYAYVSRGLVRSVGASRAVGHVYLREDLERIAARRSARQGHAAAAAGALRWGEPVLDTAISFIDERGPRYRGHLSTELVRAGRTFEEVAELLWTGALPTSPPRFRSTDDARARAVRAVMPRGRPITRLLAPLSAAAAGEAPYAKGVELERARGLVMLLATHAGSRIVKPRATVAATLAVGLGIPDRPKNIAAIDAALVLLADHELNASSFASRVAASAGAGLAATLLGALMVFTGNKHGGAAEEVEELVERVGSAKRVGKVIAVDLAGGAAIPGFHHRLYPGGDPRAVPLLELARRLGPRRRGVAIVEALILAVRRSRGDHPTVDAGLVALAHALGAPAGSAGLLFGIGRVAGWVAHALEQREQEFLLRPRARYVGPLEPT